ncbi:MAG TPA: type II toxin-antitoxin system ParD family antitoxin [Caulifigura sp.]|jgi:antitoxin ParD1/3/4|nr:type II toxin-antitoxin system ParD family antitoxin [Caulifigura sp.]
MSTSSIQLTDEQRQFVQSQIDSGRYPNAEAVLATALDILEREIEDEPEKRKALLAAAKVGFDELDAGLGITFTDSRSLKEWMDQKLQEAKERHGRPEPTMKQ